MDERLAKHIAYWIALPKPDKEEFRRSWPWLAELYDTVVRKYVGNDPGQMSMYRGFARAYQINDHMSATRGQKLPECPSLSLPRHKGEPHSRAKEDLPKMTSKRLRRTG